MEKKSVGLLELETAILECFLEKTPLSPLGVNIHQHRLGYNIIGYLLHYYFYKYGLLKESSFHIVVFQWFSY
jgi:hypothetical protein